MYSLWSHNSTTAVFANYISYAIKTFCGNNKDTFEKIFESKNLLLRGGYCPRVIGTQEKWLS